MSIRIYNRNIQPEAKVISKNNNLIRLSKNRKANFQFTKNDESLIQGSNSLYKCECLYDDQYSYMIQVFEKNQFEQLELENFLATLNLFKSQIQHHNLVKIVDYYLQSEYVYIVMERLTILRLMLENSNRIKNQELVQQKEFIFQISMAIRFLHENGLVLTHFDLDSIGVDKSNTFKIMNFQYTFQQSKQNQFRIKSPNSPFMAPEIRDRQIGSSASDIYCLGVAIYQFITKDFSQNRFIQIQNIENIKIGELIQQMLIPEFTQRITIQQLFLTPFFTQLQKIIFFKNILLNFNDNITQDIKGQLLEMIKMQ